MDGSVQHSAAHLLTKFKESAMQLMYSAYSFIYLICACMSMYILLMLLDCHNFALDNFGISHKKIF